MVLPLDKESLVLTAAMSAYTKEAVSKAAISVFPGLGSLKSGGGDYQRGRPERGGYNTHRPKPYRGRGRGRGRPHRAHMVNEAVAER